MCRRFLPGAGLNLFAFVAMLCYVLLFWRVGGKTLTLSCHGVPLKGDVVEV